MGVNPDAVSRLGKLYGGRFPSSPSSRSQKINYFNRLLINELKGQFAESAQLEKRIVENFETLGFKLR